MRSKRESLIEFEDELSMIAKKNNNKYDFFEYWEKSKSLNQNFKLEELINLSVKE